MLRFEHATSALPPSFLTSSPPFTSLFVISITSGQQKCRGTLAKPGFGLTKQLHCSSPRDSLKDDDNKYPSSGVVEGNSCVEGNLSTSIEQLLVCSKCWGKFLKQRARKSG